MRHLATSFFAPSPWIVLATSSQRPLPASRRRAGQYRRRARGEPRLAERRSAHRKKPQEYSDSWSAFWLLDERPQSGWAAPQG